MKRAATMKYCLKSEQECFIKNDPSDEFIVKNDPSDEFIYSGLIILKINISKPRKSKLKFI
jgi:hypothetical protein